MKNQTEIYQALLDVKKLTRKTWMKRPTLQEFDI
jgi:hypothetical protein